MSYLWEHTMSDEQNTPRWERLPQTIDDVESVIPGRRVYRTSYRTQPDGTRTAGMVGGVGMSIFWQAGPISGPASRRGAVVEDVLAVAVKRLEQLSEPMPNPYTKAAVEYLELALEELADRQADRKRRGVQGTYKQ